VTAPPTIEPLLYAPQARLIDLSTGRVIGVSADNRIHVTGATSPVPNPADTDLISARVTLVNTGVGQLQVVLNNARNRRGKPDYPPWKYNDFSASSAGRPHNEFGITFGQRIRLDIRYGGRPWRKMILARVTAMQFGFPASGGAQLTVTGEDLLSLLNVRPREDHRYNGGTSEETIIENLVSRSNLGLDVELGEWPERAQGLRTDTHRKGTTYLQYLQGIADRMDLEIFVDFKRRREQANDPTTPTIPGPPPDATAVSDPRDEVKLHVVPSRSLIDPEDYVIQVQWEKHLIDFTPQLKVWEQPVTAHAAGSGPDRREHLSEQVTTAQAVELLGEELFDSPKYDVAMVDAITARREFYGAVGDGEDNASNREGSNLDRTRLRLKAIADLRRRAREFMTAEGNTIGFAELRPGIHVHVLGLRPPFDGFYYVTKTVHSIDTKGYRTAFSVRRPGMLPPSAYLTAPSEAGLANLEAS
jgi:phage protein D